LKTSPHLITVVLATILATSSGHSLATVTWGSNGNFTDFNASNAWSGNTPNGSEVAAFASSSRNNSPVLMANATILGVQFATGAKAYILTASAAQTLTIGSDGILNNSSNTQTFNVPIILVASQTWNSASGAINAGGTVNLANFGLALNGTIASSSTNIVSGAGSITKSGAGTWTLSGANTYSGGTTLSAGTLAAGSNTAFGTGAVTIAGGTLAASGGARSLTNVVTATGNFTIGGTNDLTFTNTFSLGPDAMRTITVSNSGTTTISGQLIQTYYSGMTKQGTGRLVLSGNNTFSGVVKIEQGTLAAQSSTALGISGTWGNTIASGATLEISNGIAINEGGFTIAGLGVGGAGAIRNLSGTNSIAGQITLGGDTTITSDAGNLTFTSLVDFGSFNLALGGTGNLTFSEAINGSGGVTKTGAGTVTMTGVKNYGGATIISGGILSASNLVGDSSPSSVGASSIAATNLVLNGGTLRYTGAAATTNRLFSVGTSGGTIDSSGSGALAFNNTGALGFNSQTGARTLTFTGSNNASFAPVIGDNSGATSITKTGTGTFTLSAINTYTGATTISGGTLVFTGNKSGTGAITVSASGKLAGTSTVAGTTTVNGTISPGAITGAAGNLTTGAENWQSGGHYLWDITNATGTAGTGWDLLSINGALAVNSTSGSTFFIDITGTASNFSGTTNSYSWIIASASSISGFAANKFTLNAAGLTNSHPGTFSISQVGNNLQLNYVAPVPEPESWGAILGASVLLIALIRRRQRA
jgi:autotransporter-associated beta strand protein